MIPTTSAAIYIRADTTSRTGKISSYKAQREMCLSAAADKGWSIAAEYPSSVSKDAGNRPHIGLDPLLEAAQDGVLSAVIVPSLNHLGDSARSVLRTINDFTDCGVVIVSCNEDLDTKTDTGRYALRLFKSLAELDREAFVLRAQLGRAARGRLNGERGGQMPMGYRRLFDEKGNSTGVAVDEDEAETVRYLFVLRSRGTTLQDIADKLNDLGVTTSRGKKWHASSVRIILENEDKYRGGLRGSSSFRWPVVLH